MTSEVVSGDGLPSETRLLASKWGYSPGYIEETETIRRQAAIFLLGGNRQLLASQTDTAARALDICEEDRPQSDDPLPGHFSSLTIRKFLPIAVNQNNLLANT